MAKPLLDKLAIFGVGLIGGSLALALREAGAVGEVVGVGRSVENLNAALEMGAIDRIALGAADAVLNADLVLLAMPVGQMGAVMANIAPHLQDGTVVTDAGSTKQDVVALAQQYLPNHLQWFVPGHPIAGAEHSGVKAARADLYRDRNVVLAPLAENTPAALETVDTAWRACGANVSRMTAGNHDSVFAAVSHLPHLLAFALVGDIAAKPNAGELFHHAASGFRDFTRIASGPPEMWTEIGLENRHEIGRALETLIGELGKLRTALENEDRIELRAMLKRAKHFRDELKFRT